MTVHPTLENSTYSELRLGEAVSLSRTLSARDTELFAALAGGPCAAQTWGGLLFAMLAESQFPGPGSVPVSCDLHFSGEIKVGTRIETKLTVREKYEPDRVLLDCLVRDEWGMELVSGTLLLRAPEKKIRLARQNDTSAPLNEHVRHSQLVARCAGLAPAITAVVHPCDLPSLTAAVEAAEAGLIIPILIGPEAKILAAAAQAQLDIAKYRLVTVAHSHAAASEAVAMARRGEVEALMKGSLHTDELMHAVVAPDTGLGTDRRISHCYLFDVAAYPRPLFVTDAAINIAPNLAEKRDILQNAIDLAHIMGVENPKVAILSAVETVSAKLPSTLDAAALCKMADRGQITGAALDGPLAFDNAVSLEAARIKGIVSPVAGRADILLVPELESGNMLAKQLTFFEGADGAGIVLGARLPIILTSRADPEKTRIASCAMALLLVAERRGRA
jgi:phosphotransacetylase